jgi:hypothetical protein
MPAMVVTHLPYFIAAGVLVFGVRRTRRAVERMAGDFEEVVRRRS